MSRPGTSGSVTATAMKGTGTTVQLPSIPRLTTDEKSRAKYITDYDRFEPELRKHHIGTEETTTTISLKDVPTDFDRTVPAPTDLTAAERELETYRLVRVRPVASTAAKLGGSHKVSHVRQSAAEAANGATTATASAGGTEKSREQGICVSAAGEVSFLSPDTQTEQQNGLAVVAAPNVVDAVAREGAPAAALATTTTLPRTCSAPPTTQTLAFARTSRHICDAANAKAQPRNHSAGRPPTIPPQHSPSSASHHRRRPPTSSMKAPAGEPNSSTGKETSVDSTARLLNVLLDPPPEYLASLQLDMTGFDLEWMRDGRDPPHPLVSLASPMMLSSRLTGATTHPAPKINSPRSVLAMLEHGMSLRDWDVQEAETHSIPTEFLTRNVGLQSELRAHRRAHVAAQRQAMQEQLEHYYNALCTKVPLRTLVARYRDVRHASLHPSHDLGEEEQAKLVTAVQQRQERQRRVFETNKVRMARQIQQAKELQECRVAAEQRRQQAEEEAEAERQRKADEDEQARRLQRERLEARRAEREQREEVNRQELQQRLLNAEARNQARLAIWEKQQKAVAQEREAQAADRARRMERNAAALEEQAIQQAQKRNDKERKLAELRVAREARLVEEQRAMQEKQQHAAQQRKEARLRAAEAEEAVRQAAAERQQLAETRLQAFHEKREGEAAQRAVAEAEHRQRKAEARMHTYAQAERFRASVQDKLQQHEDRYQDTRAQQLADLAWRREAEWEKREEKAHVLLQLQRLTEFKKVRTIVELLEKRRNADGVMQQRELVLEQAMRDRDRLRDERDEMKAKLAQRPR